jgi:hypothetical protein
VLASASHLTGSKHGILQAINKCLWREEEAGTDRLDAALVESDNGVLCGSGAPWSLVVWKSWLWWPLLRRFIFSLLTLLFSSELNMAFFSRYAGVTYFYYFQPANSAVNPEGRTTTSSLVAVP